MRHRGEQLPGVRVLGRVEDLLDRARLDDDAVLHHHDAVGEVGDDAHVVRDEDDRRVEARVQVAQQVEDLGLHGDVERRRRLVRDEQERVARDRLRDHRALALTARELVRVLVERLLRGRHLDEAEQLDRLLLRHRGRHPAVVRTQRLHDLEADRVHRVQRRHRLLEDRSDLVAAQRAQRSLVEAAQLAPEELDRAGHAGVLGQQAEERHRARALARAGLAHDGEHLAAPDDVVHVDRSRVELPLDPELHAEVVDLEDHLRKGLMRCRDLGLDARRVSHSVCPICKA